MESPGKDTFAEPAHEKQRSVAVEIIDFARHNKKWWITPILLGLFLVSALVILGGSGVAPFIYALF
jgi:hypothetical protein